MRTILIVDRDLGFVFWLGQALYAAGYQTLPAKNIAAARSLLVKTKIEVDLLIVGETTPGVPAFAAALRRAQRHLKLIVLMGQEETAASTFPEADAWRLTPSWVDKASKDEWLETIQDILAGNTAKLMSIGGHET